MNSGMKSVPDLTNHSNSKIRPKCRVAAAVSPSQPTVLDQRPLEPSSLMSAICIHYSRNQSTSYCLKLHTDCITTANFLTFADLFTYFPDYLLLYLLMYYLNIEW